MAGRAPLRGDGIGFLVRMPDALTFDPWWLLATATARTEAYRQLARITVGVYTLQARAGIGKDGRKLKAISDYTRRHRKSASGKADPSAPPFVPGWDGSRIVANLRAQVTDNGVWMYWTDKWGIILDYHAKGLVRGAPIRDSIGLSPQAAARIEAEMIAWTRQRKPVRNATIEKGKAWVIHTPHVVSPKPVVRVPVPIGVDLDKFVFHTGDRALVERMAKRGTFSGFRSNTPRSAAYQKLWGGK